MKGFRAALALTGVTVFLAVAGVGAAKAPARAPLLGFVPKGSESSLLTRLNPLTLVPRRGRTMRLDGVISAWSLSPDASKLAVASGGEAQSELRVVDTTRMRSLGRVVLTGQVQVTTIFWADAERLFAVVTHLTRRPDGNFDRQPASLVAIDPATRQVVEEQSLDGYVQGSAHAQGVLALILGAESGIGPARLAVVGADGRVTTIQLDGVTAGFEPVDESNPAAVSHYREPGLVLTPDGTRAYVASPGQLAAIDLRTLAVSYHRLGSARRLQKGAVEGSSRSVQWVRDGVLLVTGHDDKPSAGSDGTPRVEIHPTTAELVDTRDWSVRALDSSATYAAIGSDAIALMGPSWSDRLQKNVGSGVTFYGLDGVRRAHLFGTTEMYGLVVGRRAFVVRSGYSYAIVSTTSGRIMRTVRRLLPTPLLPQFQ